MLPLIKENWKQRIYVADIYYLLVYSKRKRRQQCLVEQLDRELSSPRRISSDDALRHGIIRCKMKYIKLEAGTNCLLWNRGNVL